MTEEEMQIVAFDEDVLHGHAHIRSSRISVTTAP